MEQQSGLVALHHRADFVGSWKEESLVVLEVKSNDRMSAIARWRRGRIVARPLDAVEHDITCGEAAVPGPSR